MGSSFHELLYCFAIPLRSVCVWRGWGWGARASTALTLAPPDAPGEFPEVLGLVLWIHVPGQEAAPAEGVDLRAPVHVTKTRAGFSRLELSNASPQLWNV